MSILEITASILGIVSVWLVTKQNIWCWPTGIAMVILYIIIFYKARLYSDMLLQIYFVAIQIYAWHLWLKREDKKEALQVSSLKKNPFFYWLIIIFLLSVILGFVMKNYTKADLPYIDSTTTAISVVAQWLMTKKYIENWFLWIIADIIYVVMYIHKTLYPTAILYFVFLFLAFLGYLQWKKELEKRSVSEPFLLT